MTFDPKAPTHIYLRKDPNTMIVAATNEAAVHAFVGLEYSALELEEKISINAAIPNMKEAVVVTMKVFLETFVPETPFTFSQTSASTTRDFITPPNLRSFTPN